MQKILTPKNTLKTAVAIACAALFSNFAVAQQQVTAKTTTTTNPAAQGSQQGVVYPGQPIQLSPQMQQTQQPQQFQQPTQSLGQTLIPGSRAGATLPVLPALPGEMSQARQAVEDTLPADTASAILELRKRVDEVTRAGAAPIGPAPISVTRSIDISQAPGETPPAVRVAPGIPTNIVFMDSTGASWPISYVTPGAPGQFDIMLPEVGTPTVEIRAKTNVSYGGLTVKLQGNDIPISITLTASQKQVDARVDAHLSKRGPNAAPITLNSFSGTMVDPILATFLDGVPPAGAKPRKSSMSGISAWNLGGVLYVRTSAALASPSWTSVKGSGDGMRAYALPDVSTLTVSVDGVMTIVNLSE
jgi:intracellular multiplication protein IcmK